MGLLEPQIHSFIIKIWLEESIEEAGQMKWRGQITHVPSGERRYLKNLKEIVAFIFPYLQSAGINRDAIGDFGDGSAD